MVLVESLSVENIVANANFSNPKNAISALVSLLDEGKQIPEKLYDKVVSQLIEREKQMSTGIGKGVALPHCALDEIDDFCVALAVLEKGINFEAIDDEPVFLIVLLLSPKSKMQMHVKNLAGIAKFLSNEDTKQNLISLKNPTLIKKFIEDNATHAK